MPFKSSLFNLLAHNSMLLYRHTCECSHFYICIAMSEVVCCSVISAVTKAHTYTYTAHSFY
uniref:Uncharacterized protein n=2 Tax=Anguilla anguilla TaxID=7936 RepID=A0A0E9TQP9_ANGAN